jgi:AcrR family transcriptional regulator
MRLAILGPAPVVLRLRIPQVVGVACTGPTHSISMSTNGMIEPRAKRGPGRPPLDEARDTRQELLDAALDLFASQGYAATSVRQIANAVGVSEGSIYFHFEGKQALFDELIQTAGPRLLRSVGFDFENLSEGNVHEVLPGFFERLVDAFDEPRSRMLVSVMLREARPEGREVVAHIKDQFIPHLAEWARRGELRDDVSAEMLAWGLVLPLAAIRMTYLNADAPDDRRATGRSLAKQHIDLFLKMTARESPHR